MTEIQCTSCHTRYRIDERLLPDDTPTFKCSRCGHVFNADPIPAIRKSTTPSAPNPEPLPRSPRPGRSKLNPPSPAERAAPTSTGDLIAASRAQSREVAKPAIPAIPPAPPEEPPADELANAVFEDPSKATLDDHPLNRTFGDHDKPDTGENLAFDFSREDRQIEPPEHGDGGESISHGDEDQWQIGETAAEFDRPQNDRAKEIGELPDRPVKPVPPPPEFVVSSKFGDRAAIQPTTEYSSEEAAEITTRPHSSGFFLAMYLGVAIVFLVASYLISGDPVASARLFSQTPKIGEYFANPVLPAMLVSLHDVRSQYRALKGGNHALIVTGTARNVGRNPLHLVQIEADLLDGAGESQHALAHQSVYAGNDLSAEMLSQMTPREIEFSQSLSPQKSFAMAPAATVPFLLVFINPPQPVSALRLSVGQATPAETAVAASAAH